MDLIILEKEKIEINKEMDVYKVGSDVKETIVPSRVDTLLKKVWSGGKVLIDQSMKEM